MITNAQAKALLTGTTISQHIERMGWIYEDETGPNGEAGFNLGMLLCDLRVWAAVHGADFEAECRTSAETFSNCYDAEDVAPVGGEQGGEA